MTDDEIIQKIYAEAVQGIDEGWFDPVSTKWYDHIVALPADQRITYLTVILHTQVLNGGFHQYFINGYGQFAKETHDALRTIGTTKKAQLVEKALKLVNAEPLSDAAFRALLLKKKFEPLLGDDLDKPLDELDNEYYTDGHPDDIWDLLAAYLKSRISSGE